MLRIRTYVAGITLSAITVLGMPVPAAQAASDSCILSAVFLGSDQYRVTVGCTSSDGAQAQGFSLRGEDTFADDNLGSFQGTSTIVLSHVLDEDLADSDEVYANVGLRAPNGSTRRVRTNTIRGSF